MISLSVSRPSGSDVTQTGDLRAATQPCGGDTPAAEPDLLPESDSRPTESQVPLQAGDLVPVAKVLLPRRRGDVLTRPRLLNRLYDMVDRKLVLVSAPAGYGKTTLLVDFAHDLEHPVCWYTLDPNDRDPRAFLEHLVLSLHHRFPSFGERTHQALAASSDLSHGAPGAVNVLIHEMMDVIPQWFVLVLDDYHWLGEAPEVGAILARCLTYQTGQFLLVIASRTIPALPSIIQLAAKSEVGGLGLMDLRFSAGEIQGLLAQNYKLHIPDREARELAAQSEGWITGILLTAHTMWQGILQRLVQANVSDQPVYEYLAQEVFDQQTLPVQTFLTASSVLQEMSPALCLQVLGLTDAERFLALLEERNLFVTHLEGEWYRYHHLFQEYLQARLRKQDSVRWNELHHRAAKWFEAHERPEMAVHHYLAIGSVEDAARVMQTAARDMFLSGRLETLMAWKTALPASMRERAPRLALIQARAADMLGRCQEALELTEIAERGYRAIQDQQGLAYTLLHRCEVWQGQGRHLEAMVLGEETLSLIEETGIPVTYEALRILGKSSLALGNMEEGEAYLRQALACCQEQGGDFEQASVQNVLADCLWWQGRWEEAIDSQRQAVATRRRLKNPGTLAAALNDLGFYLYSTGEYGEALLFLEESLALARRSGFRRAEAFALISLSELGRDLGNLEWAIQVGEAGLAIADELGEAFLSAYGREALGLVYRCQGKLDKAQASIEQAVERAKRQHSEYQLGRYSASLGLVLAEAGKVQAGLAELACACKQLEGIGARGELARAQFFSAWTLFRADQEPLALDTLHQAFKTADTFGREFLFVVEGRRALALLEKASKQGIGGEELARLLTRAQTFDGYARDILQKASPSDMPADEPLRIYAFGQGRVERNGREISVSEWEAAATRYLLFYLLVDSPRTRDQIAAALWPELAAPKVKATFHTTKFRLKRALSYDALHFDGRGYWIHPELDYWFDVAEFERLLAENGPGRRVESLQQAIDLYRGDFLEDCYADWCSPYREALRERYLEALEELAGLLLARRQYRQTIRTLRRGLELDDLREEFHRRLMYAYAISGRRSQAVAQYERCAEILARELGADPSPETTTLYRRILDGLPLD
jgi:LuxR family maltose regulon positive regulatory protein